ncbi:Uncharacterised protein [Bacillus freudenreichii]|nr:Uncharacterised protein [Bacillus freudenreichii]
MYKYLAMLIFAILFILSFPVDDAVQASEDTSVIGIIKEDTTWTKEKSPYYIIGDVQVGGNLQLNQV